MTKNVEQKTWAKPQLIRLGTIADVAGNASSTGDGNPAGCANRQTGAVTCS